MQNFLGNTRRTAILVSYLVIFLGVTFFFGFGVILLLSLLGLTLVVILLNLTDCVAILGNIFYGRGEADKAAKLYQWSIAHKTKSPAAHLYYATYLLRRDKASEAAPLLDTAATLNPPILLTKNIRLTQASCQYALGNVDGAIEILEKMRRTFDYVNASVLSTLGYMYFLKDDMEQAESITQAALQESPDSYAAWDNLGQIRYKQKDLPQAKEAMLKAISFKEDLPDSLYYLGLIANEEGETAAAADYFKRALDCNITPLNTVTRQQIIDASQLPNG